MTSSTQSMRLRLKAYMDIRKEMIHQNNRLDQLRTTIGDVRSPSYNPGKTASSPSDTVSRDVLRIQSIEEHIEKLQIYEQSERTELEALISHLVNAEHRTLLRMRYFDLLEWEDITFSFYGDRIDYLVEEKDYRRKLYRLHTRAIGALSCTYSHLKRTVDKSSYLIKK